MDPSEHAEVLFADVDIAHGSELAQQPPAGRAQRRDARCKEARHARGAGDDVVGGCWRQAVDDDRAGPRRPCCVQRSPAPEVAVGTLAERPAKAAFVEYELGDRGGGWTYHRSTDLDL